MFPHLKLLRQTPITASPDSAAPIAHLCRLSHSGHSSACTTLVFADDIPSPLAGLVRIPFAEADAWFEEDEQIYVHPKDPYKRVDILSSMKEVRVEIAGREVARSPGGMWLFETGLPVRYYLEKTAVSGDSDLLGAVW